MARQVRNLTVCYHRFPAWFVRLLAEHGYIRPKGNPAPFLRHHLGRLFDHWGTGHGGCLVFEPYNCDRTDSVRFQRLLKLCRTLRLELRVYPYSSLVGTDARRIELWNKQPKKLS